MRNPRVKKCLLGVLVGEDGKDELLSARLWMGTYNPGDDAGDEVTLDDATLIEIGADIFSYSGSSGKTSGCRVLPQKNIAA
jgi:hypothetical protein